MIATEESKPSLNFEVDTSRITSTVDASSLSDGYAAVKDSPNRKSTKKNLASVDQDLKPKDREKAVSRTREHQKNFSIAGFAVRKHLDFVAEHTIKINAGDRELNKEIEAAIQEECAPKAFDVCGLHSLESYTRLKEAHATVDGDIFTVPLHSGHVQGIESDRVFTKSGDKKERWVHGCELRKDGSIKRIAIHRRAGTRNRFEFEKYLSYDKVFHHGCFQRIDQKRGVSPLLASANDFQDIYENKAYGLARSKVAQMFGLVAYRESDEVSETPDPSKGHFHLEMERERQS